MVRTGTGDIGEDNTDFLPWTGELVQHWRADWGFQGSSNGLLDILKRRDRLRDDHSALHCRRKFETYKRLSIGYLVHKRVRKLNVKNFQT
jgi:hypothetical protein